MSFTFNWVLQTLRASFKGNATYTFCKDYSTMKIKLYVDIHFEFHSVPNKDRSTSPNCIWVKYFFIVLGGGAARPSLCDLLIGQKFFF